MLREVFAVDHITILSNDDAQGIGEQRIGEGKDIKDLVYIRVGYDVGASILIDANLYTGADNLAGAFGHMIIDLDGPECSCCKRGCLYSAWDAGHYSWGLWGRRLCQTDALAKKGAVVSKNRAMLVI